VKRVDLSSIGPFSWSGLRDAGGRVHLADCVRQSLKLAPIIHTLSHTYQFYLGALDAPTRLRQRVESAIAQALYSSPPPVGTFQELGIHYHPSTDEETPVQYRIKALSTLRGMPTEVVA
jgi:hypothetical protein